MVTESLRFTRGGAFVALFAPAAVVRPYLKAGAGYYDMSFGVTIGSASSNTTQSTGLTETGVAAGGGLRLRIDRGTSVGIEGLYHQIRTSPEAVHMVTVSMGCYFGSGS